MNVFLLNKERDLDIHAEMPWNHEALTQDLALSKVYDTMAADDDFIRKIVENVLLRGQYNDCVTIYYRQSVMKDCFKNETIIDELYKLSVETIESKTRNSFYILSPSPSFLLYGSGGLMGNYMAAVRRLRKIVDESGDKFESEGLRNFCTRIRQELSNSYLDMVDGILASLNQADSELLYSARLGVENKGTDYVFHKFTLVRLSWWKRLLNKLHKEKKEGFVFHVSSRDESSIRALNDINNHAVNDVSIVLAHTADYIYNFFSTLRGELAFYKGCVNLNKKISQLNAPTAYPEVDEGATSIYSCKGLYDISLLLSTEQMPVSNDLQANGKDRVIVTGANRGGKTTFLRSVGQAQLLLQNGLFVPAHAMSASVCDGLFTHFRRREDALMNSGKLDEELSRMSEITDHLKARSLVLFNESFAATNNREGSEIASQVTRALQEKGIRTFFVTHLYDYANYLYEQSCSGMLFLCAERLPDATRTFRILEGKPLETSYGQDLYYRIFGGQREFL